MSHLDEDLIRSTLQDAARSVSVPTELEERLIASARTSVDLARVRPAAPQAARRGRRWLPLLAAAVVAAIAIAVTVVARHGRHAQPTHPSPTPTQSTLAPVPAGFTSVDVSFADPQHGWALGTVTCPNGKDKTCPSVIRTSDGGRTWGVVGAPIGYAGPGSFDCSSGFKAPQTCVARVTFVNDRVGYLWSGTTMYVTLDGGSTWTLQSGNAIYVATTRGMIFRLSLSGRAQNGVLEMAPIGSSSWHQLPVPGGGRMGEMSALAAGPEAVYVLKDPANSFQPSPANSQGGLYRSLNGGQTWQLMNKNPTGYWSSLVAAKDDSIAVLRGEYVSSVTLGLSVSTDGGRTFGALHKLPVSGIPPLYALSADRALAVGPVTEGNPPTGRISGTLLYRTTNAGRSWRLVLRDAGAGPYLSMGFTSASDGYRLAGDLRSIWTTSDGGETWVRHLFR
jgi:photosystem II stability/assembly factor-like uncharacterized protein